MFALFEEYALDFAVVTETWFGYSKETYLFKDRARGEFGIHSLDRMRRKTGHNNSGGSVSILFRPGSISFKEYKIKREGFELICARGKMNNNQRPFFVLAAYLSTKLKADQYHQFLTRISEAILKIKTEAKDPYIPLMGDFNNKDLDKAIGDYNNLDVILTNPTRGTRCLDLAAVSFRDQVVKNTVIAPLASENGSSSDHQVVVYEAELINRHCFSWICYSTRRITPEGQAKWDNCMETIDWEGLLPEDPGARAEYLHKNIVALKDRCFPMAHFKIKSTEDPWIDEAVRKRIEQRRTSFKTADGVRTDSWRDIKKESDAIIADRKKKYCQRMCQIRRSWSQQNLI